MSFRVGLSLFLALPLVVGCLPKAHLEVLEPADVALPGHIQTVAVIDRSRPANFGQGLLGTIEGIVTGEDINADRDGAREALRAVAETLRNSPRFEVIQPSFDRQGQESNLFDSELDFAVAKRICEQYRCDGIVSLEAFDSDSWVHVDTHEETQTDDQGREVVTVTFAADRETRVVAAWRVYDTVVGSIADDLRDYAASNTWSETGETRNDATSRLPSVYSTVQDVGFESGLYYGRRVAPTWVWVSRSYYGGGDPRMKDAKRYVKADDWGGAAEIWQDVSTSADSKLRGKATYNRALARELEGDLDGALGLARQAAVDLPKPRTRDYVRVLQRRISDRERLRQQLAPPPAELARPPVPQGVITTPGDDGQSVRRGADEGQEVSRQPEVPQDAAPKDEQGVSRQKE